MFVRWARVTRERVSDPQAATELGYGLAAFYGVLQGVTEFLPVSSSGHLKFAHRLGVGELPADLELPFDVMLHAATLVAIVVAFSREILAAAARSRRFYFRFALAIVPAGLAGLFGRDLVTAVGASFYGIGASYVLSAVLLGVAHKRMQSPVMLPIADALEGIETRQAGLIGGLQIFALLPGVSRSGSTIAAGLIGGLPPELAVAYSFLVGLPLIAGAAAKDALDGGFSRLVDAVGVGPISVAFVASLVSGLGSIALLKLVVGRRRLDLFAGYCGLLALVAFALALLGR